MSRIEPTLLTDYALDKRQCQEVLCVNLANTRTEINYIRDDVLFAHAAVSGLISFAARPLATAYLVRAPMNPLRSAV